MHRAVSFRIPAVASLALGTLTACGDTIEGLWTVTQQSYNGQVYDFPVENTYDYAGSTYSYALSITLNIGDELTGVLSQHYTATVNGEVIYDESYDYAVAVTDEGAAAYTIQVEDDGLSLDCFLEADTLDCSSDDGLNMVLER